MTKGLPGCVSIINGAFTRCNRLDLRIKAIDGIEVGTAKNNPDTGAQSYDFNQPIENLKQYKFTIQENAKGGNYILSKSVLEG